MINLTEITNRHRGMLITKGFIGRENTIIQAHKDIGALMGEVERLTAATPTAADFLELREHHTKAMDFLNRLSAL